MIGFKLGFLYLLIVSSVFAQRRNPGRRVLPELIDDCCRLLANQSQSQSQAGQGRMLPELRCLRLLSRSGRVLPELRCLRLLPKQSQSQQQAGRRRALSGMRRLQKPKKLLI